LSNAVLVGPACADVLNHSRIALPSLRALFLYKLKLDVQNAHALSRNLCNMTELIHFQLSQASMPTSAIVALAPAIARMRALQYLGFMVWHVGDEGAKAVGEALATIPAINTVRMSECEIGDVGAHALLHAFATSELDRLRALDLRDNPINELQGKYSFNVDYSSVFR
jgi:Ran GTPase-activating protein (RanGAP) involved in mRNA processing and transport